LGHTPEKNHCGGFERVGKQERHVEMAFPDAPRNAHPIGNPRGTGFTPEVIDERCGFEYAGNPGPDQQGDLRFRKSGSNGFHRGNREHRIADPVWTTHEDFLQGHWRRSNANRNTEVAVPRRNPLKWESRLTSFSWAS